MQLAHHFARELGAQDPLDEEMVRRMQTLEWKGNVRELRNYVERVAVFGSAPLPTATESDGAEGLEAFATAAVRQGLSYRQARAAIIDRFTQRFVHACLDLHDGDIRKAAQAAQVARRHFDRLRKR